MLVLFLFGWGGQINFEVFVLFLFLLGWGVGGGGINFEGQHLCQSQQRLYHARLQRLHAKIMSKRCSRPDFYPLWVKINKTSSIDGRNSEDGTGLTATRYNHAQFKTAHHNSAQHPPFRNTKECKQITMVMK